MTNKVNYRTLKDEQEKDNEKIRQHQLGLGLNTVSLVEIYTKYDFQGTITTMINWGSIGSVDVKTAESFSKLISFASFIARTFKYNGYTVTFEN